MHPVVAQPSQCFNTIVNLERMLQLCKLARAVISSQGSQKKTTATILSCLTSVHPARMHPQAQPPTSEKGSDSYLTYTCFLFVKILYMQLYYIMNHI